MGWRKRIILALTVAPVASAAAAQGLRWEFTASPYLWVPGSTTSIETGLGTLEADAGISDVLSATEFALMGVFEARRGRWALIADLFYADLSERTPTPFGTLFANARVRTELRIATGYAAYRLHDDARTSFELLGGFRAADVGLDVTLSPGVLPGQSFDLGDSWVDPVVGGRLMIELNDQWFVTAIADFGGRPSGSERTWQAAAIVGYRVNHRWTAHAGWRHMSFEREMGGRDVEIDLGGPLVGLSVGF
ncbi:MAG: hypothetical protein KDK29_04455 [Sedimentitalea sp.]|nr:hypothetical protein [Sedimentitalea sp.]